MVIGVLPSFRVAIFDLCVLLYRESKRQSRYVWGVCM